MNYWNPHGLKDADTGKELGYVNSFTNYQLSLYKNLLDRFSIYENTISIIIQGPLNYRSIKTIPNYLKYGEVVVSCWDNDNISMLDEYKNNIKIVVNKYSKLKGYLLSTNRRARPYILQNYTTLNGLKASSGHLSIKVRSDESYPILDPLISMLKFNRDSCDPNTKISNWFKIVTSNIYFRYDKECKFHPSDHIIAGSRTRLLSVFDKCLCKCFLKKGLNLKPEQLIAHSAIESYIDPLTKKHGFIDIHNSVSLMQKHFDIIRISNLPNCTWTSSYRKYRQLSGEEDWCHHINDLSLKG